MGTASMHRNESRLWFRKPFSRVAKKERDMQQPHVHLGPTIPPERSIRANLLLRTTTLHLPSALQTLARAYPGCLEHHTLVVRERCSLQ